MRSSTKLRLVRCPRCRNVLPEPADVPVYKCGACDAVLQAKKRKNDDSLGKLKMEKVSNDDEASSSSSKHLTDESEGKSHDQDPKSLTGQPEVHTRINQDQDQDEDKDAAEKVENSKRKMVQFSDDQEVSHQRSLVNSINEPYRNSDHIDPRSSTELSGHEDPESSPEAIAHKRISQEKEQEQEQNDYQDAAKKEENITNDVSSEHSSGKEKIEKLSDDVDEEEDETIPNQRSLVNSINELLYHESSLETTLENPKNGDEYEESSRELSASPEKYSFSEPPQEFTNKKMVSDSDGGSKSSFKSLIAEKLLDTRQKKVVYMEDEETLSENESADLCHRRRFERKSSLETLENTHFSGNNYYNYEGSVSSFDDNENHYNRRQEFHPLKSRWSKDKGVHRSTEVKPYYGNARQYRPPVVPTNAKMERLELLKMVQELQDQLERTNVSNAPQKGYYDRVLNHNRMAFSGEASTFNRLRDDDTCHHCRPQDRRFSAQLPHVCCNAPRSGPQYGPTTYYTSHSEFDSPRSKPEPDGHYHWKNISPKKRYVRPIAGGSPWVTCYRCSEVLQLPQSFLVFKKRCHSLRCGSCMKVLNFTVSNGTHVHRYYPEETIAAPPSSEVEDYGASRGGPVSCSDRSFQKSYSTETDRNDFSEERRRKVVGMSRDTSGSNKPSSSKVSRRRNTTSEIEEIEPAANGSPLHWLMGYASPSKVIRG